MVNLLMRFYEISGGSISIDGVDTKSVPRWNVHDQFSMVLQDTWVFRGTVRENIAYSKPGVTNKQIEDACKAVGLDHFIRSLPDGYDTVLDDKSSLSQGQKQLLTIARAMVQDAPILILDGRYPHRRADPEGHGRADRGAYELCDRAPPLHDSRRRHDSRHEPRRRDRARHA